MAMTPIIEPLIQVHTKKTVKNSRPAVRIEYPAHDGEEPTTPMAQYRLLLNCRGTESGTRVLSSAVQKHG
jgi:hypothetical protein